MITEKIKTFEDACQALGLAIPEGLPELLQPKMADIVPSHIQAMLKLEIITAALNEGWQWIPDGKQYGYYPWFWLYTTDEIAEMRPSEVKARNVIKATDISEHFSGLGFATTNYAFSTSAATYGSRLAFKSRELAEYCGTQFIELWKEYLFYKIA